MSLRYGVLVMYNRAVDQSRAWQIFHSQLFLVVADNSTQADMVAHNRECVQKEGHLYLDMQGNQGLSKAYNRAVEQIQRRETGNRDIQILIMDDDTIFAPDFLHNATLWIEKHPAAIYLPIVKAGDRILSPCVFKGKRVCAIQDVSSLALSLITGINSGMIVSLSVYKMIRYNEKLFLDYIDHDFFQQVHQQEFTVCVLPQVLQQDFSIFSDDLSSTCRRLQILRQDLNVFYSKGFADRFLYHWIMMKRKLRAVLRFKRISIVWKC